MIPAAAPYILGPLSQGPVAAELLMETNGQFSSDQISMCFPTSWFSLSLGDQIGLIGIFFNRGCNVTTWSSPTCEGLNYDVEDSACHNVLFAAVSYSC